MHRKNGSGGQARVRRGSGAPGRRLRHAFDGRPARCEMAAREEQLLLASASKAISARMMQKQYMPTALLVLDLPAGSIEASGSVPKFATDAERSAAERLDEYVMAVRATIKVFAKYHHKKETLAEHDRYFVWLDSWAQLSGFGSFCDVSETVRAMRAQHAVLLSCQARAIDDEADCFLACAAGRSSLDREGFSCHQRKEGRSA